MANTLFLSLAAAIGLFATASSLSTETVPLVVERAPSNVRPYVLRYSTGDAYQIGADIYRVLVTEQSSGGAFTLFTESGRENLQITTHRHQRYYETFFAVRGGMTMWINGETRALQASDFATVPQNQNHSFQFTEPDTLMASFIAPGGFEKWIYNVSEPFSSEFDAPFPPDRPLPYPVGKIVAASADGSFDITIAPDAALSHNVTNGTSNPGLPWHNGNNDLPGNPDEPYFVANNRGPKFLHRSEGQVVAPLVSRNETSGNATISIVTIRSRALDSEVPLRRSSGSQVFLVLDGQLMISMAGQKQSLLTGDVAFIPANTEYSYWSDVAFTRLYVGATSGDDGLTDQLMRDAEYWDFALYPSS
ncbi:hypothetical protein GCG54_00014221 [Colletotrichum gloeosporioides]|uniref:Cupin type-2 domain-containing protein n=1 Tax=Colletotrichum gloeosporioides TaxID=474922 RepID=A0A8H4CAV7_COLGL|nr:uncharacterized protein GCG54_00014221 [Colletotrichum gloeosporioides]KAF3800422.1 hypothetical protein GCG54_00014221 [Colletotrichum gloeosporioides]